MSFSVNYYNQSLIPGSDDQWKTPFSLAIGLHILVLVLSLLPASLFYQRPDIEEVVTINLFTVEELKQPKPTPKKAPPPQPKPEPVKPREITPPPPVVKPVTSIAQEPPPAPAPPAKVVSLRPRKIKKKIVPPEEIKPKISDNKRLKALERIQARVNQQKEIEKAKHDLASLRNSIHTTKPAPQPTPQPVSHTPEPSSSKSSPSARSTGSAELMDKALKRYYIAISRKIHDHWVLPEMQNWDNSLEALIVIVVNRNGKINKSFFEKESENSYFNQFVEKTINDAAPMPHFPADLKKTQLEIGLRFHPSGLF